MAMAMAAATGRIIEIPIRSFEKVSNVGRRKIQFPPQPLLVDEKSSSRLLFTSLHLLLPTQKSNPGPTPFHVVSCLPSPSFSKTKTPFNPSTKLFVSGISFHTTEDTLRNTFKRFGQLLEINLVMDKIANRPKGFAFVQYATEEESQKAIEGMHGKDFEQPVTFSVHITSINDRFFFPCLRMRVIFVEVAKSRSEQRQSPKQNPRPS